MAQKIFTPFKSEIKSFELREAYAGVFQPGVYRGYDRVIEEGTANTYLIQHTSTSGYQKTQINNTLEAELSGILVMPNGMVVHDNSDVEITLSALGGDTTRTDAILGSINYLDSPPGATFTYLVEEGINPATFSRPNPAKEVIIGYITLDSEGHTYVRATTPNIAGKADQQLPNFDHFARRVETNTFLGINRFSNHVALKSLVQTYLWVKNQIDEDGYILINGTSHYQDGNDFIFDLQSVPDVEIWGFRYAGWDFGGNSDIHLVNGTTIRVRFVNVGAGCKFKQYTDQKGFWIPEDTNIYEHVLYTMRMEQNASASLSGFSVSPLINPGDLYDITQELSDLKDVFNNLVSSIGVRQTHVISLNSPWQFTSLLGMGFVAYKDYFNRVYISIAINKTSGTSFNGTLFTLPEGWRPGATASVRAGVDGTQGTDLVIRRFIDISGSTGAVVFENDSAPYISHLIINVSFIAAS